MSVKLAQSALLSYASPERKKTSMSFFKTGLGEYAEGDVFIGVRTPHIREIAAEFTHLAFDDITTLISSTIHEERLLALLIMIRQFKNNQHAIYELYLKYIEHVNNWDLVDLSAHYIIGAYLIDKDRSILYKLATSNNLWERRIAIVATWWFIRNNDFEDTIKLAIKLMNDKHDLIHKATGWMLREVGKKNVSVLRQFLDQYRLVMPRTALRYAIERFTKKERAKYMEQVH